MKVRITIEEVDNGIVFRWDSEGKTSSYKVWQTDDDKGPRETNTRRICQEIGKAVLDDIRAVMDDSMCSTCYVDIEYETENV